MLKPTFEEFYSECWGRQPHSWQSRLAAQVIADERWPDVIDLPTGAGKTSAIDIAVYALAVKPDVFPRRVVFVIDRRIVVDQTAAHARGLAQRLRDALQDSGQTPRVAWVADALATLGGAGAPLDVSGLRGGLGAKGEALDGDSAEVLTGGEWLRQPDQPAVIVSTVDQYGSRLMFRGYGVSARMRPVHAGLTGRDCLVLLDEVQLSSAFAETLQYLQRGGPGGAIAGLQSPKWQVTQMSATPVGAVGERFQLASVEASDDSELAKRVNAIKQARLVEIGGRLPAEEAFGKEIGPLIKQLNQESGVVGIVVNRVATAIALGKKLAALGCERVVLTGRMRGYERREAERQAFGWADPGRETQTGLRFVVATQCIEVGADLSFDALITEVAALPALRQRLGRLDRRGLASREGRPSRALIVGVSADLKRCEKAPDPVYGTSLLATWNALDAKHSREWFGAGPLDLTPAEFGPEVDPQITEAAVLMPNHLDLLSQTNPSPDPDPPIEAFLHGFRDPDQDVQVVWRADIDQSDQELASGALALVPPMADEQVSVPISAVRRWLEGGAAVPVADADTAVMLEAPRPLNEGLLVLPGAWKWSPDGVRQVLRRPAKSQPDDPLRARSAAPLQPGDVIVVPTSRGGLTDGQWDPSSAAEARDVAAEVSARLVGPIVQSRSREGDGPPTTSPEREVLNRRDDLDLDELRGRVMRWFVVDGHAAPEGPPGEDGDGVDKQLWSRLRGVPLEEATDLMTDLFVAEFPGLKPSQVVQYGSGENPRWAVDLRTARQRLLLDGSDETNSRTGVRVSLRSHLNGVAKTAGEFARRCGLSAEMVTDFELAGRLHDLGKLDRRFQEDLWGDELAAAAASEPIAKSERPGTRHRSYPRGMRHEFLSAEIAVANPELLAAANDKDLVLHLVTSHHGHGRCIPRITPDASSEKVEWEVEGAPIEGDSRLPSGVIGAESMARFSRLNRRFGWHGLAWLEAIFRLADHRTSEHEADQGRQSND